MLASGYSPAAPQLFPPRSPRWTGSVLTTSSSDDGKIKQKLPSSLRLKASCGWHTWNSHTFRMVCWLSTWVSQKNHPWVTLFPWGFFVDRVLFFPDVECCHGEAEAWFFLLYISFWSFHIFRVITGTSLSWGWPFRVYFSWNSPCLSTGRSKACIISVSFFGGTLAKQRLAVFCPFPLRTLFQLPLSTSLFLFHLVFSAFFLPFPAHSIYFFFFSYSCISALHFCFIETIAYCVFFHTEVFGQNLDLFCAHIFLMENIFLPIITYVLPFFLLYIWARSCAVQFWLLGLWRVFPEREEGPRMLYQHPQNWRSSDGVLSEMHLSASSKTEQWWRIWKGLQFQGKTFFHAQLPNPPLHGLQGEHVLFYKISYFTE